MAMQELVEFTRKSLLCIPFGHVPTHIELLNLISRVNGHKVVFYSFVEDLAYVSFFSGM